MIHSNSCYEAAVKRKFETAKIEAEKDKEIALEEARRTTEIQTVAAKCRLEVERRKTVEAEKDKGVTLLEAKRATMLRKMQEGTKLEVEKQKTAKLNIELEREKGRRKRRKTVYPVAKYL